MGMTRKSKYERKKGVPLSKKRRKRVSVQQKSQGGTVRKNGGGV